MLCEPCFSERLFKQELGKTCKNRFQQELIREKMSYVRSMIIFFVVCAFPQIYDAEGTLQHFIDGNDPTKSSWMRYIRCARHCGEQNMMVVQYR